MVALVFVPFALLGSGGFLQSFAYQAERGLQVESLGASVLIFFRSVDSVVFEHGAFEVLGEGVGLATSLSPLLTLRLLAVTGLMMYWEYRRFGRPGAGAFPRHAAALILAFMLGSKVLSPQYMIWLLPLIPLSAGGAIGTTVCTLFLATCFTTTLVFPIHYGDLLSLRYPGPELLLARNLLLVVLWVAMLTGDGSEEILVKRLVLLLLLLLALLCAMGFAPGAQSDMKDVLEKTSFVPRLAEYYSKPTVETSARYEAGRDVWVVVLTEETSGTEVASFLVSDDSGKVSQVEVLPGASEIEYPRLSEHEAIKLAAASQEVRDELSEHGPYSTRATYEDGEWTVRFYVDETGAVGVVRQTTVRRSPPSGSTTRPGS